MASVRFKRFTKPHVLKDIGRALLGRFFAKFKDDLKENEVTLPDQTLPDDEYFGKLAGVLMSPEGLPGTLNDALYAIDEMATEDGQQRLEEGVAEEQLPLTFDEKSSREDIALQVWLESPELLAKKHNEQWLIRLSSFEYYSNPTPTDQSASFKKPNEETIDALTGALDLWFSQHNRGHKTTKVETHEIDGEFWFMVRHGDTYARTPKVEEQRSEVIHYRPEKDDVVVYAPDLDEIRIHAATKGEKQLYREKFGFYLFGREDYFSEFKTYTLEPLRLGKDSLDPQGADGIREIVLREVESAFGGQYNVVLIRKSDDVFASSSTHEHPFNPIHEKATLRRAVFDVYFGDAEKPRKVQIRPPNILKLGRHCDARLVHRWLSKQKFRASAQIQE
jgi:hypothetical protein